MQSNRSNKRLNISYRDITDIKKDRRYLIPVFFILSLFITHGWLSAVGLTLFVFLLFRFIVELEYRFPIDTVIVLIASLQWIVGPILAYSGYNTHFKYHMYVDEDTYMHLAVPGCLLFWLGLTLFKNRQEQAIIRSSLRFLKDVPVKYAYVLIGIGIVAPFVGKMLPLYLDFIFCLLEVFKYVGFLFVLFSDHAKRKWWVLGGVYLITCLAALKMAMFHDLILWTLFLGIYLIYYLQISMKSKILLLIGGFFMIFIIQLVKMQFRDEVWSGAVKGNELNAYTELVSEQMSAGDIFRHNVVETFIFRINQGWIISRIMEYVPTQEPFANGETVKVAIRDALVPRLLNPDKKKAGGQENYTRFTGYELHGTSMGISVLGEGYANYGVTGAWLFMFAVGAIFSFALSQTINYARKFPSLILWLPMIFLQVVKAETEFYVVFNYLIKSLIMVALFIWYARKRLNWTI